jgi:putative FmdB family regulatory protein
MLRRVLKMPSYEFRCEVCSDIQVLSKPIEEPVPQAPKCKGCEIPTKRVWDATPAVFRGLGWGKNA